MCDSSCICNARHIFVSVKYVFVCIKLMCLCEAFENLKCQ
jgi:hypothetical protein